MFLRDLLAEIFEDEQATRILLKDLGLPTQEFPLEEARPLVRWDGIVETIAKRFPNKLPELIEAAAAKFPAYREKLITAMVSAPTETPDSSSTTEAECQAKLSNIREAYLVTTDIEELERIDRDLAAYILKWRDTNACTPITLVEARDLQAQIQTKLRSSRKHRPTPRTLFVLIGSMATAVLSAVQVVRSCTSEESVEPRDSATMVQAADDGAVETIDASSIDAARHHPQRRDASVVPRVRDASMPPDAPRRRDAGIRIPWDALIIVPRRDAGLILHLRRDGGVIRPDLIRPNIIRPDRPNIPGR